MKKKNTKNAKNSSPQGGLDVSFKKSYFTDYYGIIQKVPGAKIFVIGTIFWKIIFGFNLRIPLPGGLKKDLPPLCYSLPKAAESSFS